MRTPSLGGLTNFIKLRCVEFSWVRVSDSRLRQYLLRQYLEDIRPANTTVVTQLAAEGALIELEVTALRRQKR
jgi:enamine deaminase RidA (YjgF/YER057c/UK114 family)